MSFFQVAGLWVILACTIGAALLIMFALWMATLYRARHAPRKVSPTPGETRPRKKRHSPGEVCVTAWPQRALDAVQKVPPAHLPLDAKVHSRCGAPKAASSVW